MNASGACRKPAYITAGQLPEGAEIIRLQTAEGVSNEAYLINTLEFYDYPAGELAYKSAKAIKRMLAALDDEYLTPRTLAGIGAAESDALARWQEHEEKAAPLRERLRQVE